MANHAGQTQTTKNKVFINPNYNRKTTDNFSHLNTMYLNPHFCHPTSHNPYQSNDVIRPKIYVNPNFIRNSSHPMNSQPIVNYPSSTITHTNVIAPVSNVYQYSNASTNITPTQAIPDKQISTHITNSRYCLVNKQENKIKPIVKQTNTISVNKYKLVPLKDVQSKLYTEKKFNVPTVTSDVRPPILLPIDKYKNKLKPILQNSSSNRFKFVRHNTANLSYSVSKLKIRRTSILNKSLTKPFTPPRKVVKGRVLKKNNIPCPLFKKYGKCLRKTRGTCEYLHDKKHVSICRKFLKGICHDEQCLLSHDLTDKKMPTCHFYLQGACTKENCPYLHVKLNEKASVCLDFLKGYCEKGDKCLNRHINIACSIKSKERNSITKVIRKKSTVNIKTKVKLKTSKEDVQIRGREEAELNSVSETRYFKETIVTEGDSDLIRPTRCKLGLLPSFIQL